MEGDLLLAGVASALMRNAKPTTGASVTSPTGSGPVTAQFSSEQIDQLAGALVQGVSNIQLPVTQVQFPSSLQATISDEQIARITSNQPGQDNRVFDILNRTVQSNVSGLDVNTPYPSIKLLDQILFIQDVRLVGIVLSASLLNTTSNPIGLFCARVTNNIINLQSQADPSIRASDIYLSLITHNNSTVGTNAPASRTASIGFSPKVSAITMKSGSSIGIYGACEADGTALMTGCLSVFYVTEE
jgi:hypothetical protein